MNGFGAFDEDLRLDLLKQQNFTGACDAGPYQRRCGVACRNMSAGIDRAVAGDRAERVPGIRRRIVDRIDVEVRSSRDGAGVHAAGASAGPVEGEGEAGTLVERAAERDAGDELVDRSRRGDRAARGAAGEIFRRADERRRIDGDQSLDRPKEDGVVRLAVREAHRVRQAIKLPRSESWSKMVAGVTPGTPSVQKPSVPSANGVGSEAAAVATSILYMRVVLIRDDGETCGIGRADGIADDGGTNDRVGWRFGAHSGRVIVLEFRHALAFSC
jgi:hypothetical protein